MSADILKGLIIVGGIIGGLFVLAWVIETSGEFVHHHSILILGVMALGFAVAAIFARSRGE